MRSYAVFDGPFSLETLDLRLSPTSLSLAASLAPPVISQEARCEEDPLPDPEPTPGTYPGTPPPPTSGPVGPGT
jgi:hypothetical protein